MSWQNFSPGLAASNAILLEFSICLKDMPSMATWKHLPFVAGLYDWRFWGGKFVFSKWNWIKLASNNLNYWYPGISRGHNDWVAMMLEAFRISKREREPQDVYLTEYSRNSTRLIASKSWVITRSHSPTEATYSCMVSNIFVVPSSSLKQCKDRHVSIQGDIVIQFILPISNRRCL